MIRLFFYLIPILIAVFFGYRMGAPAERGGSIVRSEQIAALESPSLISETKSFAVVIYGYQDAQWCKRILRSVFEQDYDRFRILFFDDGSSDATFETVQAFVLENRQEDRVVLIRNEEPIGPVACMYRAIDQLADQEIVISLEAKDWLTHPKVLTQLNALYQDRNIWVVASTPVFYPSYEKQILSDVMRDFPVDIPIVFYAGLFKYAHPPASVQKEKIGTDRTVYVAKLLETSKHRFRVVQDPLFMINRARPFSAAA